MSNDGEMELYKKYRPTKFSELYGQEDAVEALKEMGRQGKVPHSLMFSGPSGTGKTTVALILKNRLKCHDMDWQAINIANDGRGVDIIRDIGDSMGMVPMGGPIEEGWKRIWLLDEFHKETSDGQNALLDMTEFTPDHVYFILTTTEPEKIIKPLHTRFTEIHFRLLKNEEMLALLKDISARERFDLDEDVADKIVECAEGSPRKALVLLNAAIHVEGKEKQLNAVTRGMGSSATLELARLIFKKGVQWKEVAACLNKLDEDPEDIRRGVLGYARKVMLNTVGDAAEYAWTVTDIFKDSSFYSGRAGVDAMCYEAIRR
jgi:DNA polymerase-3 subunit gamma/tau